MSQLDTLLAAVGAAPALPGARCRGRHHLFDEQGTHETTETTEQRHQQALGLCQHCTALASCQTWFDTLTPSKRPPGVIAGRIIQPKTGRPPKATA
ncbi:hypothetical protein FPV58_26675 [Mycolicibacterium porcinum]|nr:hypothetical protein FPV58_26675 [Mycolicibacterium porcinum]